MADPYPAAPPRREPGQSAAAHGFGGLAHRIAGWTTNGLATALIVVAGLTLGRQVLVWWRQDPAAPTARRMESLQAEEGLRHLQFGGVASAVKSRMIRGNHADALAALRDMCRPADRPAGPGSAPTTDAERNLLAMLAKQQPAESGDGWRIDCLPRGMPLVICSTTAGDGPQQSSGPLDLRIVAIGLAVPAEGGQWSAYAFHMDHSAPASDGDTKIPLPVGSARRITLSQPDGSVLTTFSGRASVAAWEEHFRTTPAKQGWKLLASAASENRRHLEFEKDSAQKLRAEVHFEYDGQGELHGLLLVTPTE